jgi:hypothetical protein
MVVFMTGSPLNARQNSCLWTSSQESCVAFKNDITCISGGTNPLIRTVHNEVKTVCHLVLCRSVRLLYVINFSSTGLRRIWGVHGDAGIPCSAMWRRVDRNIALNVSIFRARSNLEVEALVPTWQSGRVVLQTTGLWKYRATFTVKLPKPSGRAALSKK